MIKLFSRRKRKEEKKKKHNEGHEWVDRRSELKCDVCGRTLVVMTWKECAICGRKKDYWEEKLSDYKKIPELNYIPYGAYVGYLCSNCYAKFEQKIDEIRQRFCSNMSFAIWNPNRTILVEDLDNIDKLLKPIIESSYVVSKLYVRERVDHWNGLKWYYIVRTQHNTIELIEVFIPYHVIIEWLKKQVNNS